MKVPEDFYTYRFHQVWSGELRRSCNECERAFRKGDVTVVAGVASPTTNRRRFHEECYYHGAPWRREMAEAERKDGR